MTTPSSHREHHHHHHYSRRSAWGFRCEIRDVVGWQTRRPAPLTSHLFDTLQPVIGLLYVSVHRRNRVHVDCPSSASTCQPLTWSNLEQKHRHIFKDRLCPSGWRHQPAVAATCVSTRVCVCVGSELRKEILIWQVTSTSGSPKEQDLAVAPSPSTHL